MTQQQIIEKVLSSTKSKKEDVVLEVWFGYLSENLKFPFEAEVHLLSYSRAVSDGDIIKVIDTDNLVDLYGMLMKVKKGSKTFFLPLEELEVCDTKSKNFIIINAFLEWYQNIYV